MGDSTAGSRSELACRVRAARAYSGLSVSEVADRLGVGVQTIKRIEAGTRAPRQLEIWAIAQVCGLSQEWFEVDFRDLSRSVTAAGEVFTEVARRLKKIEAHLGLAPPDAPAANAHGLAHTNGLVRSGA